MQKLGKGLITASLVLATLAGIGLSAGLHTHAAGRGDPLPVTGRAVRVESGVFGTAVGVAPGILITNSHVVRGCQRQGWPLRVVGLPGTWAVRVEDADADLAVLAGPTGSAHPTLALSGATRLPRGTTVTAFGFPAGHSGSLQSVEGEVLRAGLTIRDAEGRWGAGFVLHDRNGREVQPRWEDGLRYYGAANADRLRWTLEIDAVVGAGSSGGPVVDAAGHLIGIIYAGDPARRLTAVVPIDDVREFLRRAGVYPRIGTRQTRAPDHAAAEAVFQIRC